MSISYDDIKNPVGYGRGREPRPRGGEGSGCFLARQMS